MRRARARSAGCVLRGQGVDAGDPVGRLARGVAAPGLLGVPVRGLAAAEPGEQDAPPYPGGDVVGVQGDGPVEHGDRLRGTAEVLREDGRLVLQGRPRPRVELQRLLEVGQRPRGVAGEPGQAPGDPALGVGGDPAEPLGAVPFRPRRGRPTGPAPGPG